MPLAPPASLATTEYKTRGVIPAGKSLTPGFVLRGSGTKNLVIRAVGPRLADFGVPAVLADPTLAVIPLGDTAVLFANDDWCTTTDLAALKAACDRVGAFGLIDGSKDAAVAAALPGGRGYSVQVAGKDATAGGTALAEVYDADPASASTQIINVSTLAYVGREGLTPGFVIGGESPKLLLIRAVGPTLGAEFHVPDVLPDPQLKVVPLGKDVTVASNNDWGADGHVAALQAAFTATGAFGLVDGSKDAAVLVRLPPG